MSTRIITAEALDILELLNRQATLLSFSELKSMVAKEDLCNQSQFVRVLSDFCAGGIIGRRAPTAYTGIKDTLARKRREMKKNGQTSTKEHDEMYASRYYISRTGLTYFEPFFKSFKTLRNNADKIDTAVYRDLLASFLDTCNGLYNAVRHA